MMRNTLAKINITPIIRGYVLNFKNYRASSYSLGSLTFFFLLPFCIGVSLPFIGVMITETLSGLLIGLYSIFAGLFFSFQIFVFDILSKIVDLNITLQASKLRVNKFEYISRNISFCILLCFIGFLALLVIEAFRFSALVTAVMSGLSFYILTLFILSLLTALKGVHVLITEEISIQKNAIEAKFEAKK